MGRSICLLWIVTACYAAKPADGLPCSETMQCPDGQTCDPDTLVCYAHPPATMQFQQLAAGDGHTCGIAADGSLYCWGDNYDGQLGVGDADDRHVPTRVGDASDWTQIAAGGRSTCGLRGSALWCWGNRLDVGVTANAPVQVMPETSWAQVSVSYDSACALDASGGAWCHVYDDSNVLVPLPIAPISSPTAISVDGFHQCVIDAQHQLFCWGDNGTGVVGDGTQNDYTTPYQHPGTWLAVSVRGYTACAIASDSHLWCWGSCDQDEATGTEGPGSGYCLSPSQIGTDTYLQVAVGDGFTCAIRSDHVMVCFGRNLEGELGASTISQRNPPIEVPRFSDWTDVVAGGAHVCGLRANGEGWCWGDDDYGQLGIGETSLQLVPVKVDAGPWLDVSTGLSFTCGRRADSTLWCWGENGAGQLGDGTTTRRSAPGQIGTDTWTKVSAGGSHTCGIRGGALYCWGDNRDGQLGLGNTADVTEHAPRQVGIAADWTDVAAGNEDTLASRSTGLYYFGDYQIQDSPLQLSSESMWKALSGNAHNASIFGGILAVSSNTDSIYLAADAGIGPDDPTGITSPNWSVVALGTEHQCGISASAGGALLCWGDNYYGELGSATNPPDSMTAVTVQGGFDWKAVDAGDLATCGITDVDASTPEELYCWGSAKLIPLPITSDTTTMPQRIAPGVRWSSVSIADHHGCAIRKDGSLWCWGDNLAGEVGIGPTAKNAPVPVHTPGTM